MYRASKTGTISLIMGYAFLYLPIMFLIIYSFSSSRIPGVWTGFSLKWYKQLFENSAILSAFMTSLKIASISATLATILGTCAAISMVRFGQFKKKILFSGLVSAPLITPEVIIGLAFLLMFVTLEKLIGWPSERGITTVIVAHTTLALAYVYLLIKARLIDFDKSIEEAAADLGAKPFQVFMTITLPLIFPSLLTAWLLAFALSLDDVVLASFLSAPGATTLPILIFSNVRIGITPEINALASVIVGLTSFIVLIVSVVTHKYGKRYIKDK